MHESELEFGDLTERIIGAAIAVHRKLGPGFLESIYEAALTIELRNSGLDVVVQKALTIEYEGHTIGSHRLDMLVESQIVVELKAIKNIEEAHFATTKSYLRAANLRHGLILNFSKPRLEIKRVIDG